MTELIVFLLKLLTSSMTQQPLKNDDYLINDLFFNILANNF